MPSPDCSSLAATANDNVAPCVAVPCGDPSADSLAETTLSPPAAKPDLAKLDPAKPDLAKPGPSGHGLLAEAALRAGDRVLIIGARSATLLCAAVRRGCRSAAGLVQAPAHPEPADVVLATAVTTEAALAAVAGCARRALREGGRLVLALPGLTTPVPPASGCRAAGPQDAAPMAPLALAPLARDRLRAQGFRHIRLRAGAEGALLLLGTMPRPRPQALMHPLAAPLAARAWRAAR